MSSKGIEEYIVKDTTPPPPPTANGTSSPRGDGPHNAGLSRQGVPSQEKDAGTTHGETSKEKDSRVPFRRAESLAKEHITALGQRFETVLEGRLIRKY